MRVLTVLAVVVASSSVVLLPAVASAGSCTTTATGGSCTYTTTGAEQDFVVPAGVSSVTVTAIGGAGGTSDNALSVAAPGGRGARVTGAVAVTPGSTLRVEVGERGSDGAVCRTEVCSRSFNGGGHGGAAGGGASDVRTLPRAAASSLDSRLLVAAGGGGGGGSVYSVGGSGGDAGAAGNPGLEGTGGGAATSTAGGTAGTGGVADGAPGVQGTGGDATGPQDPFAGGGGGGGLYGGGAGGSHGVNRGSAGGGGGGSNLVPPGASATLTTDPPSVTITWRLAPSLRATASDARPRHRFHATATLVADGTPTGTITFRLYRRHDPTCSQPPIRIRVRTLSGNGTYGSGAVRRAHVARFQWRATYSGDATHPAVTTSCGSTTSTVSHHPRRD